MIDLNFRPKAEWRASAIPKKDGSLRYLLIPSDELKQAQHDVLDELYKDRRLKIHYCATGFVPYRNTLTGAMRHAKETPLIIQLDIHNFFPTFPVRKVLQVLKEAGMERAKVDYIEEFCVFHGKKRSQLPQGSPTSPYLTNLGMYETDGILKAVAKHFGYLYTRYADDMAFSVIPGKDQDDAIENRKTLMAAVSNVLQKQLDLNISWKKTLVSFENSPKVPRRIVGVTIRKDHLGYNAPRKMRKTARAIVHNLYNDLKKGVPKEDLWPSYWKMIGLVGYSNHLRGQSDFIVSGFDPMINREKFNYVRRSFNYASRSEIQ